VGLDSVRGSEAVELFVERARSHRQGFVLDETNVGSVTAICRQLDGIPLAIELAAARLSSLALGALEARLDDRFRLLTKGARSALGRHQTLRAAVEWSCDLLDEPERVVLRRLAVFAGGFSLEAAEAVCQQTGLGDLDVVDVVDRLVDRSLIQADEQTDQGRYRLLETIRQFGQERLADHDETTAIGAAHAEVFLDLAETAAPRLWKADRAGWVAALRVEADNLRLAMATFLSDGQSARKAMRLAIALSRYWEMTASTTEAVTFGRAVLDHTGASENDRLWVETVTALALVWRGENWELGIFKPEVTKAVELARRFQLHQATSVLLWALAADDSFRDSDSAIELVEQAVAEAYRSGDPTTIGVCLIGSADRHKRDPPQMRARLTEARRHLVAGGDSYWESVILNNLAVAHIYEADYESARPLLEQGLDLARPTQDDVLSYLLGNLGQLELIRGHVEAASQAFGEALEYQVRTGSQSRISADLVLGVAMCASANKDSERAVFFHGAVEMMTTSAGVSLDDLSATIATEDHNRLEALLGRERYEGTRVIGMALTPRQATEQALLYLQQSAPTPAAHRLTNPDRP
jgi:tetratricopeptide (TPR) repeat protein